MATSIEKEGKVKSVNDFGFKFEGSDDYYDYSKQSEVERAAKGETVRVRVSPKADGKWWVNSLERTNGSAATTAAKSELIEAAAEWEVSRQGLIVRQSCLKAAVEFYGTVVHDAQECGKGSDHVLQLAEKFEEWVNR